MNRSQVLTTSLCLILGASPVWLPMRAAYAGSDPPSGSAPIDEQRVESKLIEGDELFQAPAGVATRVELQGIGQVLLTGGTSVRLGASASGLAGELSHRALVASLLSGEVVVDLDPRAGAYVQVGEAAFSALNGSHFRAGIREGRAVVETSGGMVRDLGNWAVKLPPDMSPPMAAQEIDAVTASVLRERLIRTMSPRREPGPQSIGTIEAMNAMTIDGRVTHEGLLWGNELLQVPVDTSANVSLDTIGQVVLTGGTEARLAAFRMLPDDPSQSPTLMATLMNGGLVVKLDQKGSALIRAGGLTFTAFTGARFRLTLRDGQVLIEPLGMEPPPHVGSWVVGPAVHGSGEAVGEAQLQPVQTPAAARRYVIRPLDLTTNLSVRARSAREIQYRVTDENDRPVPDVPVVITLGAKGGKFTGVLSTEQTRGSSVRAFTDQKGVARATFSAGLEPGLVTLTAIVEGTSFATAGTIGVTSAATFFSAATLIPVLATVAVGVTAGAIAAGKKEESKELPVALDGPQIVNP